MKLDTLNDLYIDELRDLYHAETQLARTLPELAKAASSEELQQALKDGGERTRRHIQRLETIFEDLRERPSGHKCKGMEGLLEECRERVRRCEDSAVTDAGLIVMAQKAQHYEMAGYGSARSFARMLGREEDAAKLNQTLEEEKQADAEFTLLAQQTINLVAASAV